jgi:hypothetical protein
MHLQLVCLDLRSVDFLALGTALCGNVESMVVALFKALGQSHVPSVHLHPSLMLTTKTVWALATSMLSHTALQELLVDGATEVVLPAPPSVSAPGNGDETTDVTGAASVGDVLGKEPVVESTGSVPRVHVNMETLAGTSSMNASSACMCVCLCLCLCPCACPCVSLCLCACLCRSLCIRACACVCVCARVCLCNTWSLTKALSGCCDAVLLLCISMAVTTIQPRSRTLLV